MTLRDTLHALREGRRLCPLSPLHGFLEVAADGRHYCSRCGYVASCCDGD